MDYQSFIQSKLKKSTKTGFQIKDSWRNKNLFDYQKEIVTRSCEHGRYALFMDTGLGKSITQMNYADAVNRHTNKPVLMLAPLAVVYQMKKEAEKFGFDIHHSRDGQITKGLNITNYESLHKFDCDDFGGVILDESSILKGCNSKTRRLLTDAFRHTPYRLACTATPSPNDHVELGMHSEFLGNYTGMEMRMMYFTQDRANVQEYILKGHAEGKFWEWVASWAECISSPADLGYDGSSHILPALNEIYHEISHDDVKYCQNGSLFEFTESNATTISRNKRATIDKRAEKVAEFQDMINPHLVWCDTNDEADKLRATMPWAIEVRGNDKEEYKAEMALAFANGEIQTLISKASIFGYGMNFQNVHNMTFTGLNYSYESYYQAVRRMWRFGQKSEVNVNIIVADNERLILESIHRKKQQHEVMKKGMLESILSHKVKSELKVDVFNQFFIPSFIYSKEIA